MQNIVNCEQIELFSSKKTHTPPFWDRKDKTGAFFLKYRRNMTSHKWQKCTDSRFLSVRNAEKYWFMPSAHQKSRKCVDSFFLTIINGKIFYSLLSDHFKRRNFIFCALWALESLFFLFFWPIALQYGTIVYYLRCVIILKYLKYFVAGPIRWKGFI